MLFKIALRNILRNRRRSVMSIGAIAVGAIAMVLFGGFVSVIILGLQTDTVRRTGHLAVYRSGYFTFGSGNPAAWGMADYKATMAMIAGDAELGPKVNVVTPTVSLFGIAGNFAVEVSRTFIGSGVVPAERDRMRRWNPYNLQYNNIGEDSGLDPADPNKGIIGAGLARVLGLCEALRMVNCPPPVKAEGKPEAAVDNDIAALAASEKTDAPAPSDGMPHIDLLAATAGGAPNVISLSVSRAERQGVKEYDDAMVLMHFDLAQRLLYGRAEPKAIAVVVQLHSTADLAFAKARIAGLIKAGGLDLEVRDFVEIVPFYGQVLGMFGAIFGFIAAIMGVIVLFTVVNTMGMSVMERTAEIGTARAIGLRRSGIRRQFLLEGWILGAIGATVGLALGVGIAFLVNRSGMTWLPPGQSAPSPLYVMIVGMGKMHAAIWVGLMLVATLAAIIPANRAARMQVVDALRHV